MPILKLDSAEVYERVVLALRAKTSYRAIAADVGVTEGAIRKFARRNAETLWDSLPDDRRVPIGASDSRPVSAAELRQIEAAESLPPEDRPIAIGKAALKSTRQAIRVAEHVMARAVADQDWRLALQASAIISASAWRLIERYEPADIASPGAIDERQAVIDQLEGLLVAATEEKK